jgi:hypothetical protein
MALIETTKANVPAITPEKAGQIMEAVLIRGDLSQLTHEERAKYYIRVCDSLGLNPMTKPFEYLELNKRLVLYARKDCTDQLRRINGVSITELSETEREGVWIVTAYVRDAAGRTDAAKGAVSIVGLKGEALANALMKAETKAKRRATLSLCGLGFLDESEVDDIPAVAKTPPTKNSISQRAIAAGPTQAFRASAAGKLDEPVDELPEHSMASASREPPVLDCADRNGIPAFLERARASTSAQPNGEASYVDLISVG